jgi:hypothetical protein
LAQSLKELINQDEAPESSFSLDWVENMDYNRDLNDHTDRCITIRSLSEWAGIAYFGYKPFNTKVSNDGFEADLDGQNLEGMIYE